MDDALRLYHGEFLAGFHVRGARNFDAWLSEQREHWRQVVLDSVGTLGGFYETNLNLTLKDLKIDEQTLVLFTTDNGSAREKQGSN